MSRVLTRTRLPLGRHARVLLRGDFQCRKIGGARAKGLPPVSDDGYVVLLPEIPPDTPETNQLLRIAEIPNFDTITKEACRNAIGKLALEVETHIWRIEDSLKDPNFPRTYEAVLDPIEKLSVPFNYTWSIIKTLNVVKNDFIESEVYKKLHYRARLATSKKYLSLPIYHACKEIKVDAAKLQEPQLRVVDKFLLEGKLSGVELTGDEDVQMKNCLNDLEEYKRLYAEKVTKSTEKFQQVLIDPQYIGEMPVQLLRNLAKDKSQPSKGPWIVTLDDKVYKSFLEYCPERALRWNAWLGYNSRSSGFMDRKFDNSITIEDIRDKRAEKAKLLGFNSYAELSMQTKMAGNIDNVKAMLATLFTCAKPKQDEELEKLKEFAASRGFDSQFKAWDIDFWRRKQRSALFSTDEFMVSEYFTFPHVWNSLCEFAEELFGIKINQKTVPAWHEDVSYYEVLDSSSGQKMGGFYVDPYTRPGQKLTGGSWMLGNKSRCGIRGVDPLATLVFNFQPPKYGKPSLLNFEDLHLLLEQFGRVLQHVLTTVPFNEVSGTTNIEWDAVLVPSKFMTMWLGNKTVVKQLSSHFDSGEKLPDEQVRELLRARKHMSAYDLCHKLYLSHMDLELYSTKDHWKEIVAKQWKLYKDPLPLDKKDAHLCSFPEILSGEYAAAYYCTLWSHMLAADIYQLCVESGKRESWRQQGLRFRASFLSMGGGYHPNKIFRQCRGRDPCPDAFLWSLGLGSFPRSVSKETSKVSEESTSTSEDKQTAHNVRSS